MSKRRVFTVEKKLEILREAEANGMLVTCRKYAVAQSLYYRWKHAFDRSGIDGLTPAYKQSDSDLRALEKENERLKRIIAKQALEIEVKSELLKKNDQLQGRRRW